MLAVGVVFGGYFGGSAILQVEQDAPPIPPEIEAAYRLVAYQTGIPWGTMAAWDAAENGFVLPVPTVDQIFREKVADELDRRRRADRRWCDAHPGDTTRCPPDDPSLTPQEELEIWLQAHSLWRHLTENHIRAHAEALRPLMTQIEQNPEQVYRQLGLSQKAAAQANDWMEGYLLLDTAQTDLDPHTVAIPTLPDNWQPAPGFAWPVLAPITSRYGIRTSPIDGVQRLHAGIDLGADLGTPIHAAKSGTVISAASDPVYGLMVLIKHDADYTTLYAHQFILLVTAGQQVKQGDVVGLIGNTGLSTGPHLHFEVQYQSIPVDPLLLLRDRTEME